MSPRFWWGERGGLPGFPRTLHTSTKAPHACVPKDPANKQESRDYAYHLYAPSSFAAGRDLDNWLEAKACLSSGIAKSESRIRLHPDSLMAKP